MAEKPANIGAYKNMNTAKKDMSPGFLKATEKDKQKAAAKDELSAKENAATADVNQAGEGVDGAAETEENVSSNFVNNVSGRGDEKGKGKGKGFFSKKGPITLILILTLGVGGLTLGGQAMQPFALVSNIIQNFDSASYSTTARLNTTLKAALTGKNKIKLSDKLKNSLELSGIKAKADADGNLESLEYKSKDGSDVEVNGGNIEAKLKDVEFSGKVAKTGEMVENDSFFTSKAKSYAADRIGWVKNRWDDFDSGNKNKAELETEFKNVADDPDSIKVDAEGDSKYWVNDSDGKPTEAKRVLDDDGVGHHYEYKDSDGTIKTIRGVENGLPVGVAELKGDNNLDSKLEANKIVGEMAEVKTDAAGNVVEAKTSINLDGVTKAASGASAAACIYSTIASSVAAITIAKQVVDMINIASGYMEAVQKVQAGDGDGSSLHMYNNETNQTDENGQGFWSSISISSLFGGKTSGESAGLANVENVITGGSMGVLSGGVGVEAWKTCTYSKIISNGISVISDVIAVFTAGIGKVIKSGLDFVVAGAVAVTVSLVIKEITSLVAEIVKTDVIENMGSIFAGDYTVGGGNYILKQMGRATGLSAGDAASTEAFANYSESVIVARASYDRDNLSPFDITNRNTFLGSIAYSFTQFAVLNSGNMLNRTLSSVGSVLSNAASSFMPMTSATVYSNIASQVADSSLCPLATSVGATATANHCFDYSISDTRTFEITYEEAKKYLCEDHGTIKKQLEDCNSGTPKVKEGSEMAKYIGLWTQRDVHLGLPDANATNHNLETNSSLIDGVIGAVPFIGDGIDILNSSLDAANAEYILGSAYVAGASNSKWDKLKQNIQAYLELDSVYSDLAIIENSTLAMYLDEYYEKNPLDTSYEGVLARISGRPKEEVISTLAYIDYMEYVANYNPSSRYSFIKDLETKYIKGIYKIKNDIATILENITYSDIRNRNFVA